MVKGKGGVALMRNRTGWILIGTALALVVGACGVPVDDEPRALGNLPDQLYETTTPDTTPVQEDPNFTLTLYFFNDTGGGNLVRVARARDNRPSKQDALYALAAPTEEEVPANLSTNFPSNLNPTVGDRSENGALEVNVNGVESNIRELEAPQIRAIYTQIVCTLTDLDETVRGIQILDESGPIPGVNNDAEATEEPVTRADVINSCKTIEELTAEATAEAEGEGEGTTEGEETTTTSG